MRVSRWQLAALAAGVMLCVPAASAGGARFNDTARAPEGTQREVTGTEAASEDPWVYLGPQRAQVSRIAISPQDPSRMLALLGTERDTAALTTIYQSDVAGLEWRRVPEGVDTRVHDLVVGTGVGDLLATSSGVWMRAPGESDWVVRRHPQHLAQKISRVAQASGPSAPVWVTAELGGAPRVYRLTDHLQVWNDHTPALPPTTLPVELAASPDHPGRIALAMVDSAAGAVRVFVTEDQGITWVASTAAHGVASLSSLRWVDDSLFVGGVPSATGRPTLWASDDVGATWQLRLTSATDTDVVIDVAGDPAQPGLLWAGTPEGLYRTLDGGHTWTAPAPGQQAVTRLEYVPQTQQLWAARRESGTWVSPDGGESWEPRNHRLGAQPVTVLAANPLQPGELAAAVGSNLEQLAQVATSDSGGLDWVHDTAPYSEVGGWAGRGLRFAPSGDLYATLTGQQQYTLFRRRAGDWQHVGFEWPVDMQVYPNDVHFGENEETLLLSGRASVSSTGAYSSHVWRSGDAGQSWASVLVTSFNGMFQDIERTGSDAGVQLFALQRSFTPQERTRLWTSGDDGLTWSEVAGDTAPGFMGNICTGESGEVLLHLVDPVSGALLLHRSDDGGATWRQTAWMPGVVEGTQIISMHCPDDARRIFLSVYGPGGGVWMSEDGGESFEDLLAPTDTEGRAYVTSVQLTPHGLYMGSLEGVWVNPDISSAPPVGPYALAVQKSGGRMRPQFKLQWQGGLERVDIHLNGTVVATVDNSGTWSQVRLASRTAEQWQVCDAGTSDCSAVVEAN